jgi:hypothetical protein
MTPKNCIAYLPHLIPRTGSRLLSPGGYRVRMTSFEAPTFVTLSASFETHWMPKEAYHYLRISLCKAAVMISLFAQARSRQSSQGATACGWLDLVILRDRSVSQPRMLTREPYLHERASLVFILIVVTQSRYRNGLHMWGLGSSSVDMGKRDVECIVDKRIVDRCDANMSIFVMMVMMRAACGYVLIRMNMVMIQPVLCSPKRQSMMCDQVCRFCGGRGDVSGNTMPLSKCKKNAPKDLQ